MDPEGLRDTARAMSQENVEMVRRAYDAALRSDWNSLSELLDPDFEFHGTVGGLEEGRIARGAQQFVEVFEKEDLDAWDERRFEPSDFIDAGDCVVVLQREYRRGRGSGVELEDETAVVFEVRDGSVVRIQGYMDPVSALEAVGLSEQDARAGS
jgi:ketosteroid isomerase-like protein